MDLRRQLTIIRAWIPLLAIGMLVGGVGGVLATSTGTRVYEATTTLIVGQSLSAANPDYSQLLASQRLSTTYAKVATTRPILERVIEQLDLLRSPDELATNIRANALLDSSLLTIASQDTDPIRAAAIANSVADQLIAASPGLQGAEADLQLAVDRQLDVTLAQLESAQAEIERLSALPSRTIDEESTLSTLQGRLTNLGTTYATLLSFLSTNASNQLSVVEPAVPTRTPISPRPVLNLLLGVVVGLMIAALIAFVAEYLDDTIKNADDIRELTGLPMLGAIPRIRARAGPGKMYLLVAILFPRSAATEAYRTLRTNVDFASVDVPVKTLLVTSAIPGEGKTITAANLAIVFAQAGRRVLLVDADLRQPGVHTIFDLPNVQGLTTLLRSDGVSPASICQEVEQSNLWVLTSGPRPPNPAELLGSRRMSSAMANLTSLYDLVIVDSPPIQVVTDSALLGSILDGTLLVVGYSRTRRDAVRQSQIALGKSGGKLLGAVLNQIPENAVSEYGNYFAVEEGSAGTAPTRVESRVTDVRTES